MHRTRQGAAGCWQPVRWTCRHMLAQALARCSRQHEDEGHAAAVRAACQAVRGAGARRAADAAPGGARRAQLVYLPGFWLGLAGGVAACLLPDLAIMVLRRTLAPFDFQIVQARPAPHMHALLWPGRRRNPRQRSHISHM